jgi:parallel beta-helix repeat protein
MKEKTMSTVTLSPGNNVQAAINSNPAGSTFYLTAGTYYGAQFLAKSNDQFIGDANGGTVLDGGGTTQWATYSTGATGVLLQNLTVQNYASPAEVGAIQTGNYWTLNNVTAQWNNGPGVSLGADSVISGGAYINNGQIGINGYRADNAMVSGAEIAGNNWAGYDTSWEAGGLKFVDSANVILDNNYVHDNNGVGLWADEDSSNWTITGNTSINNTRYGILYEISHGANIDNNTVAGSNGGIYISNSDGVEASGNTVTVDAGATWFGTGGIDIINDWRGSGPYGPYLSINDNIQDNTIIHDGDTSLDGIFSYQPFPFDPNNVFDNNTYYVSDPNQEYWMFGAWQYYNWNTLHQQTPYEASGSLYVADTSGA